MIPDLGGDPAKPVDYPNRAGFGFECERGRPDEQPGRSGIISIVRGGFSAKAPVADDKLSGEVFPSSVRSQRCVVLRENDIVVAASHSKGKRHEDARSRDVNQLKLHLCSPRYIP